MRLWLSVAAVIGLLILAALLTARSEPSRPVLAEGLRLALLISAGVPNNPFSTPIR